MSIGKRTITSVSWNFLVTPATIGILFARSIWLARLLPVNVFGAYALAASIVALTIVIPRFGLGDAFVHRTTETLDESKAAEVHFTLILILTLLWAIILIGFALIFIDGETQTALIVLTVAGAGVQLTETPRIILQRRVVYRRLSLLKVNVAVFTTIVSILLAWQGVKLWSLLAIDVITLIVGLLALYGWRPVWRPRLTWSPPAMRYFLHFGGRSFAATVLVRLLDRLDNLWTGIYLGNTSLGFYSRAYRFATYPREPVAMPVNLVITGTYAELKEDRLRLSQTFFRASSLLIRTGFLLAGLLALIAPEFIVLGLGEKWLPMLPAFRLMLLFTLLDPIKITTSSIFVAVGKPEEVIPARLLQLVILVAGLFLLGSRFDIAGVALAVDIMVLVGTVFLLWKVRAYIDYSVRKLFAAPTLAFLLALMPAYYLSQQQLSTDSYWLRALAKTILFTATYCAVLLLLERRRLSNILTMLLQSYRSDPPPDDETLQPN